MTREIPLTRGLSAIVDDADYDLVARYKWFASPSVSYKGRICSWYALRTVNRRSVYMHRVILAVQPGVLVDHANGNGLDNRRQNIRPCTAQQNNYNRRSRRASSGFRGVYASSAAGKWAVKLKCDGANVCFGNFVDPIEAARAYDAAAIKHHGEFAILNFPEGL